MLPMVLLLPSCGWKGPASSTNASANYSAAYVPPTLTLLPHVPCRFKEMTVEVTEETRVHSDYAFRQAVIIGDQSQFHFEGARGVTATK